MSNRRINRRSQVLKKREESFNLKQSVIQPLIPPYNALHDPFLNGFFDPPAYKRHLQATGVIHHPKRFSIKRIQEKLGKDGRTSKSESKCKAKSEHHQSNAVRLPLLEQVLTEQRQVVKTSETTRHKKFYKSTQL